MNEIASEDTEMSGGRFIVLVPLILFIGLTTLFLVRLNAGDPSLIPSALIGHPIPQTTLPPVAGLKRDDAAVPGLDPASFKGTVTVVNVWASWCVPCLDEAPLLMQLAQDSRLRLVGINYKDDAPMRGGRYGNPFAAAGADQNGRAAIEWGGAARSHRSAQLTRSVGRFEILRRDRADELIGDACVAADHAKVSGTP
jgi:cytochrome c biogenesis protein CcmG/thiol:disulfide interchange protein DsbE